MGVACCSKKATRTVPLLSLHPTTEAVTRLNTLAPRSGRSILNFTEDTEQTFREMSANLKSSKTVKWKRGHLIGEGAYAKVYQCINIETGELLAAKHFLVTHMQFSEDPRRVERQYLSLKREITLMRSLDHPNVVKYIQADLSPEQDSIDILLEYVPGGSIRRLLGQYKALEEPVVSNFTKQILEGLSYLHQHGIVHRDLKCANLLLDASGLVKITDFGTSKRLESDDYRISKSVKGSPFWMAPEVILKRGHCCSADIWSLGCVVIEMVTGSPPWSEQSVDSGEVLKLIAKPGSNAHADLPAVPTNSPSLSSFVSICLQRNAAVRPTAQQLLSHPFVGGKHEAEKFYEWTAIDDFRKELPERSGGAGDSRALRSRLLRHSK